MIFYVYSIETTFKTKIEWSFSLSLSLSNHLSNPVSSHLSIYPSLLTSIYLSQPVNIYLSISVCSHLFISFTFCALWSKRNKAVNFDNWLFVNYVYSLLLLIDLLFFHGLMGQSTGVADYTDCISAEGQDFLNKCSGYDTKQSDGVALIMQELWGMRITHLLPSLPGPLWPWVVASDRILSMG